MGRKGQDPPRGPGGHLMVEELDMRTADEKRLKKAHQEGVKAEDGDKDSVDETREKKK